MPKPPFNIEKLNDTFNGPVYYREVGYYVKQKEEYERTQRKTERRLKYSRQASIMQYSKSRGLKYFDKSLAKEPDNVRALYGRCMARAKAIKFGGAIEDIKRILTLEPDNIYLKAEKALITYLGCEFEEALIQNYRNVPLRKQPDDFVMGVMHCEDAILNCISERAGKPLRDHFKVIRKIAWTKTLDNQRPYRPVAKFRRKKKKSVHVALPTTQGKIDKKRKKNKMEEKRVEDDKKRLSESSTGKLLVGSIAMLDDTSSIQESLHSHESSLNLFRMPPAPPFPYRPLQRRTSNIENYLAEKYLEKLCQDKMYLKNLPNSIGTATANEKGSNKIKQLATQGFKNVYNTQEMLRSRRPFYFIKYQEATTCGKLDQRKQRTIQLLQEMALKQANYLISKIQEAMKQHKVRRLLEFTEKMVTFCETTSKKIFPQRQEYMSRMVDMVCESIYERKKFSPQMTEEQKDDRIKLILGLPMDKFPSTDSLAKDIKDWFVDWKKMSSIYEKRLFRAESSEELAWLYHELSRFSFELRKYELARMYARKCMAEANSCKKLKWIMNAMILIIRIDIYQKNKNDAKNQAKHAKKVANRLRDDEMVVFLERCVAAIEQSTMDDMLGIKLLEMREKQIISLLTTQKMKDEAAYLFRRIATLPPNKRMSVMPGFTYVEHKSRKQASSTSVLGESSKKGGGKKGTEKKEKPRGVTFLNLL